MSETPEIEKQNVHEVYERIADHFSGTRHSAWPLVEQFISTQQIGAIIADVGCGNGKYLGVDRVREGFVAAIGSDRSSQLIRISRERGNESIVCDGLTLAHRPCCFVRPLLHARTHTLTHFQSPLFVSSPFDQDAVISIAVIHHFSTRERRVRAVEELSRILRQGGRLFLSVWAAEQERFKGTEGQDVFVPWSYFEPRKPQKKGQETSTPTSTSAAPSTSGTTATTPGGSGAVYQRFYHLFRRGELEELFSSVPSFSIIRCELDHDNWFLEAIKL